MFPWTSLQKAVAEGGHWDLAEIISVAMNLRNPSTLIEATIFPPDPDRRECAFGLGHFLHWYR